MPAIESTSTELVGVIDERTPIIAGDTPATITAHATEIAQHLKSVIDDRGLAVHMGTDRDGRPREHVTVEGWQAMGAMLGAFGGQQLHADTVWSRPMPRDDGAIAYEARVEIRTMFGDVVATAESMCTNLERDRRNAAEHAIRSMAETRAVVRAYRAATGWIVSLAGYASTPAEEMPDAASAAAAPAWARPAGPELITAAAQALEALLAPHGRTAAVPELGRAIRAVCDGEIPAGVATVLVGIGRVAVEPRNATPNGADPAVDTTAETTTTTDQENPA